MATFAEWLQALGMAVTRSPKTRRAPEERKFSKRRRSPRGRTDVQQRRRTVVAARRRRNRLARRSRQINRRAA